MSDPHAPDEFSLDEVRALPAWTMGTPGELRDRLVALVLAGTKTATTSLAVDYELDDEPRPRPGDHYALLDSAGRRCAVVEVTEVAQARMADVDLAFARAEGEGFGSVTEWRVAHDRFFSRFVDELRERLRDPSWALSDDTLVSLERFRLLRRLDEPL